MRLNRFTLALAVLATSASSLLAQAPALKLIPMPREVRPAADVPLTGKSIRVVCDKCNADDRFAADDLITSLKARNIPVAESGSGFRIELARLPHSLPSGVTFDDAMKPEGYVISASGNSLTVVGASAEGVF
jgi:hypothetical protein